MLQMNSKSILFAALQAKPKSSYRLASNCYLQHQGIVLLGEGRNFKHACNIAELTAYKWKVHVVFSKTQETKCNKCGITNLLHKFYNQVRINEGLMQNSRQTQISQLANQNICPYQRGQLLVSYCNMNIIIHAIKIQQSFTFVVDDLKTTLVFYQDLGPTI